MIGLRLWTRLGLVVATTLCFAGTTLSSSAAFAAPGDGGAKGSEAAPAKHGKKAKKGKKKGKHHGKGKKSPSEADAGTTG